MAQLAEQLLRRSRLSVSVRTALVLLPMAATYVLLWRLVTAVPIIDDYPHIFAFALRFREAATLSAKLGLIFTTQVGPYKLIFDHALVGLQLLMLGRMDFPVLILLGNLTPLGIFAVLWRNAIGGRKGEGRWLLLLLPVSLLLFGLNYAETLDWAISGLQQPAVVLFSLAAIHFLVKEDGGRRDFALACVFGVLASATYANGVIVWPVGLGFLLMRDRREVGRLAGWGLAFALMLGVYLYHYQPDAATGHASLVGKAVFFVMFCGSALENMHHRPVPYISLAIGAAVLAVFIHAVRTRYDRRNPFFFYSTVWVLLTGVVVANARMAMGLQLAMSSRYKIYCDLLLIFCYQYLLDRLPAGSYNDASAPVSIRGRRWIIAAFAGAAIVFLAGDFAGAKLLKTRRDRAEGAMRRYLVAPESASPMFVVEDVLSPAELLEEDKARRELNEAIQAGIYTPPPELVAEALASGKLEIARPEWFASPTVDATGRRTYPPEALAGAYRATAPWGTILLDDASYVSPFYDPKKVDPCGGAMTPYVSPRRFVGVGRPHVDDEQHPQRLVGGSVILGEVCGSAALQVAHLGVDAGPAVVQGLYGGMKSNGIFLPNHGAFNPKRGTRLEDVSVLTNDLDGQHSVLIEGDDGAVVHGLWIWTPGGTHGLILKSSHSVVRDFHCKGAKSDCLLVKSDYVTAANGDATDDRLEDIHIGYLNTPGDTGGITLDGSWGSVARIDFHDVSEDGSAFGFSGMQSWFHGLKDVRIDDWKAQGMTGPCTDLPRGADVAISHADCMQPAGIVPAPKRRSFKRWCRDEFAALKPELRILWETLKTWVALASRWVWMKLLRRGATGS